uniref:Uncharacterized protein n=1 Tax=Oryza barthii TaxID=65489 RepID=A0A0D3HLN7_9ORYZ
MGFSPWTVKRELGDGIGGRRRLLSPSASASASPSRSSVAVPVPVRERRRSVLPIQITPPHPPARRTPPPAVGPLRLRLLSEIRSTAQPLLCTSTSATKLCMAEPLRC